MTDSKQPQPDAPPDWWSQNWKLTILAGLAALAVLSIAMAGIVYSVAVMSFRATDVYRMTMAQVRANPVVLAQIGQPLRVGWHLRYQIRTDSSEGDADFAIPISGPRGSGTVHAVAQRREGKWNFESLMLEVSGQPNQYNLLERAAGGGGPE
ncbi:MAG: cytochrome c oxidase assembly factor Coa1 family protein [Candidatus Acidiferrales bacterium]